MVTSTFGLPSVGLFSPSATPPAAIFSTTSSPSVTWPSTVYFASNTGESL
jgi:hypothetical protein